MTVREIVLLLLGALAGAVVSVWYNSSRAALGRWSRRRMEGRRRRRGLRGVSLEGAIAYYGRRGRLSKLYVPRAVGSQSPVAAVTESSSQFPVDVLRGDGGMLRVDGGSREEFAFDRRLIDSQVAAGARIFDGEILYIKSRESAEGGLVRFVAGRCNYFSHATNSLRLQEEFVSRRRTTSKYERFLLDLAPYSEVSLRPQAIGCSCVTLFESDAGPVLAVSNRSSEVATSPGNRATLPSFGMEANMIGARASRHGVFYYNYVREFAEEFFDLEELVQMMASRRSDPDWIFELPQVAAVEREAALGGLELKCLGVSCNPYDGALNFNLLARFTSREFFDRVRLETRANWESSTRTGGAAPIEFIGLFEGEIDRWVDQGQVHGCSVVSIDLAREYLTASG